MCLLSYYPGGIQPDAERLNTGALLNSDGHGYALITKDGLLTGKSLCRPQELISEFAALRKLHPEGPALFHSRFSTGGHDNVSNCHPYQVGRDQRTVLAHNGVLFSVGWGERRSDTRVFAEDIMPRRFRRVDRPKDRRRLERYLGGYNKMVMLTVNPRYRRSSYIFNESSGIWTPDGEWHSNHDFDKAMLRQYTYEGKTYTGRVYYGGSTGTTYWPAKRENTECDLCGAMEAVDSDTAICMACRSCTDCGEHELDCQCRKASQGSDWKSCGICFAYQAVDPVTLVCSFCHACDICGEDSGGDCSCFTADSKMTSERIQQLTNSVPEVKMLPPAGQDRELTIAEAAALSDMDR